MANNTTNYGLQKPLVSEKVDINVINENMDKIDTTMKTISNKLDDKANSSDLTSHTTNKSNPHSVTKSQIGLGNCNNTADADKNVKSAKSLTTARNINGTSFNGTADITTAKWGTSRDITFKGDVTTLTQSVDGSADVSFELEIKDNSHKHTLSNISDVTATATEVNVLNGITATTAELNYTDGVTSNIQDQLDDKAPLASPILTGTPKAPTASVGTNTTQIATTAFVQTAVSNGIAASDAMIIKGTIGTSGTVTSLPTTYKTGWTYRVVTNGTYAGQVCEIGDLIVALVDRSGSGNLDSDWCVAQTNINGAITGIKSGDAYISVSQSGSVVTITHKDITRTNTTSTAKPSHGGTFTAIDSITSDSKGHVTKVNTKTITLPNGGGSGEIPDGVTYVDLSETSSTIDTDIMIGSANLISYGNFTSGLTSNNVQSAIDELVDNSQTKIGDTADNTTTFTSADSTTATVWTNVNAMASGETHKSLFNKISTMFKNIRFLYNKLGTTDISSIGDGTVTNALSTLNSNLIDNYPLKTQISNPNLLDNPWFTVNQRGQSEYDKKGYGVDRWKSPNGKVVVNSDGSISIINEYTGVAFFYQMISESDIKLLLQKGKTITASIKLSDNSIISFSGSIPTLINETSDDNPVFVGKISDDITVGFFYRKSLDIWLLQFNVEAGKSMNNIIAVKLELGSISTLDMDISPNYALELIKCSMSTADPNDTYANKTITFS